MQKKLHIKIGDTVKVISGESKGREGKVATIDREKMRATVEGVNMIKKTQQTKRDKPSRWNRRKRRFYQYF